MSDTSTNEQSFQPLNRRSNSMYQVTFSEQSMSELNNLDMEDQLKLIDIVSNITPEMLEKPKEPIGRFKRGSRVYFRVRAGEFRCYFEIKNEILYSHYILHKNTMTDYAFRNKLPVKDEHLVEQNQSFWKYLESLTK